MPGNYTFRFVMARRDAQGAWQPIVPTRAPGGGARSLLRSNVLEQVGRRIFEQRPPLPLARWASQDQAEQGG
jgi:inner membrane protein